MGEGRMKRPQRWRPSPGVDSWAASLPLPGAGLSLHHHTPQLGQATSQTDSPHAHVEDDVAVFLQEVPRSPLRNWHHPQVLGEEGAHGKLRRTTCLPMTFWGWRKEGVLRWGEGEA